MPLGLGKSESLAAVRNSGNQIGALLGTAAMTEKPTAEHHRGEEGFEHQGPAKGLHRDHRLDRTAGRAAILLGEGQAEQPELGILRPQLTAPALGGLAVALTLLERVAVA